MPWPSDKLVGLLTELSLCSRDEIRACESHVRRLCHDLPDFDSVWIDTLVQQRVLTPWQADVLQSDNPHAIRLQEFICLDSCGENTWRVQSTVTHETCVAQRAPADVMTQRQLSEKLFELLDQLDGVRQTAPVSLTLPQQVLDAVETHGNRQNLDSAGADSSVNGSFIVSHFVSGWTAEELLIRGGRMPWPAVAEIGLQLLTALQWLEQHGLVHGDVVLRNVRLSSRGKSRLSPHLYQSLNRLHFRLLTVCACGMWKRLRRNWWVPPVHQMLVVSCMPSVAFCGSC